MLTTAVAVGMSSAAQSLEQPESPARLAVIPIPRGFYERHSIRATVVTAANVAIVLASGPLAYAIDWLPLYFAAFVLVGARAQALYILQHECMHWLLYKDKRTNDRCGVLLSGLLGTGLYYGRTFHFKHHRSVGHDDDPNLIWHDSRVHLPGWATFWFFVGQLAGKRLVGIISRSIGKPGGQPAVANSVASARISVDLAAVLIIQAVVVGAIWATSAWWVYFVFLLLPLATLTSFFEAVRSFSEHVLPGERGASPAEEARLFYMDASGLERFFFSQFGFHYHHVHHLYPGVVTFKLSALHYWLRENDPSYSAKFVRRQGYVRTALRYILKQPLVSADAA